MSAIVNFTIRRGRNGAETRRLIVGYIAWEVDT